MREEEKKLKKKKKDLKNTIIFLENFVKQNDELELSKLQDESFICKSNEYLETYNKNKEKLIENRREFLLKCNELTYNEERLKILKRVQKSLKEEKPLEGECPTCRQKLPGSMEHYYEHFQNVNDTNSEIEKIDKKNKSLKSSIKSMKIKMSSQTEIISKDYSILEEYAIEDLTLETWLDTKSNAKIAQKIINKIDKAKIEINIINNELKQYKSK